MSLHQELRLRAQDRSNKESSRRKHNGKNREGRKMAQGLIVRMEEEI